MVDPVNPVVEDRARKAARERVGEIVQRFNRDPPRSVDEPELSPHLDPREPFVEFLHILILGRDDDRAVLVEASRIYRFG